MLCSRLYQCGYYPKHLPKTGFSMWYLLETDDNVIFAGDSYVNVIFNQDRYQS